MEWAMHRLGRTRRPCGMTPVERRLYHLFDVVLQRDRVTKNAMLTSESGYQVEVNGHENNGVKKTLHPLLPNEQKMNYIPPILVEG